jgi:hypothetical protein
VKTLSEQNPSYKFNPQLFGNFGPFQVDLQKTYKPIFIVFCDMIFGITMTIYTIGYYWTRIQDRIVDTGKDLSDFIPSSIIYYLVMFNLKTFAGVAFLKWFKKGKVNKSESTGDLFWFRFVFDTLVFLDIIYVERYVFNADALEDRATALFKSLRIVAPLMFSWVMIYKFSV